MNAITPRQSAVAAPRAAGPVLQPQTFDQLCRFADMVAASELVPRDYKNKPANVMVAVQMGSELGLAPMQSLQSIAVINGRPGVWGDGLIGLCRQSPLCQDIREELSGEGDARTATCTATRVGSSPVVSRFSVADAKKAGLWNKQGPWTQYPDRMLTNRARGFALRDAFPDVLRGLKTAEELRDYPQQDDDFRGTTIEGSATPAPAPAPEPPPPAAKPRATPEQWTASLIASIDAADADALLAIENHKGTSDARERLVGTHPDLAASISAALDARHQALRPVTTHAEQGDDWTLDAPADAAA